MHFTAPCQGRRFYKSVLVTQTNMRLMYRIVFVASDSASSKVHREPRSLSYQPRVIRRLSSVEIDAFNRGLHNKRPKFIGKRRVPSSYVLSCRPDLFGNCVVDGGDPLAANKRGSRRKFVGKKSDMGATEDIIQRTTRARKFVGKRGPRKFMGRRSGDAMSHTRLNPQLNSSFRSYLDKRARRKFVG